MKTNLQYLKDLVEKMERAGIEESSTFLITANEGLPATIQVFNGQLVSFYVENTNNELSAVGTHTTI